MKQEAKSKKPRKAAKRLGESVEAMVPENALIAVQFPDNCKKTSLSIDALDSYTRELAGKTFLSVNGEPLLCRAVKVVEQGGETCLQVTVRPGCFEIVG